MFTKRRPLHLAVVATLAMVFAVGPVARAAVAVECTDPDTGEVMECPPTSEETTPPESPVDPPVETPVEQAPPEIVTEDTSTEDVTPVAPPLVVIPTPTPTPTRTAAPAPAGWNAPLYTGSEPAPQNTAAVLALAGSGVIALALTVWGMIHVFLLHRRMRRPAVSARPMDDDVRAQVLPANIPEFTAFDREMLGYDPGRAKL